MVDLPVETFRLRSFVRAIPRAYHTSHLEGVNPSMWQATTYERVVKADEGGHDLAFKGITLVASDGAARLLHTDCNISEARQLLFPLLAVPAPLFKETLDWLQIVYTTDRTGDYIAPSSTVLVLSAVLEGDPLFPVISWHLLRRFPGAYAPTPSMRGPIGPDYSDFSPVGRSPESSNLDAGL